MTCSRLKPLPQSNYHKAAPTSWTHPDVFFFLTLATGLCFSLSPWIRASSFSAGSSLGSCGTSPPLKALASMDWVSLSVRCLACWYCFSTVSARVNRDSTRRAISFCSSSGGILIGYFFKCFPSQMFNCRSSIQIM